MANVRRKFFNLYQRAKLPVAGEAVLRIGQLYEVDKQTRFQPASERIALRQEYVMRPLTILRSGSKSNGVKSPAQRCWPQTGLWAIPGKDTQFEIFQMMGRK